ncbi:MULTISPECIES: hypothetical protein [unclassified Endozoicomonas]|nr:MULTISPECIES: hypothetical protein [unclassified Endozoicomonas]
MRCFFQGRNIHATPDEETLETFTPEVDPGTVSHSSGNTGQVD